MIALMVDTYMTCKASGFNRTWETFETTTGWAFYQEAQQDLDKEGIKYTIGKVEIKQEEWQQI